MDTTGSTWAFADGDYDFFLTMPRLIAAEREMGCSIFELFHHLGDNLAAVGEEEIVSGPSPATLKQCRALIRNALIGGGRTEEQARELVETYCFPARAAILDLALAFKVLRAMIYGVQVSPGSKKKAVAPKPSRSPKGR